MRTVAKLALGLMFAVTSLVPAAEQPGIMPASSGAPGRAGLNAPRFDRTFGRIPLSFITNQGQIDGRVAFYVAGKDESIYFSPGGVTIALTRAGQEPSLRTAQTASGVKPLAAKSRQARRWSVKLDFVGANPDVRPEGQEKSETVISYFKGRPDEWRTGIPSYARIIYRNLWPGIDLVYSGTANRLKYEFVVQPGADPSVIRLALRGASGVAVNAFGQLEVETPLGSYRDETPVAYQDKAGEKAAVPIAFRLEKSARTNAGKPSSADASGPVTYGFEVGEYDRSLPLVLDPATVVYAGWIGGSANDRGTAVAIDVSGSAYVTGWTGSFDFPVTAGPDLTYNSGLGGTDAFVAKVNTAGTALVYCGYIGGTWDDVGSGIAVDSSGNAYVAGWTYSQDFPVVVGPSLTYSGNITQYSDAFVTKVSADGRSLVYSGFVGGSLNDVAGGIAVDDQNSAYIAGMTESTDFPATVGPDLSFNGAQDAFIAKVNAGGTGLVYAGYIGGVAADAATAVAVDASRNAYVTGYTSSLPSEHFPVTVGPSLTFGGSQDAFVAKVNSGGTALVYCGYIGGAGVDAGLGIAVDPSGNAYVAGTSDSGLHFPVKGGPGLVQKGGNDAFVAKVAASGAELVYCGFIGGSGNDQGTSVAVDANGIAYVAGSTDSASDFPVTGGPFLVQAGLLDAFLATVATAGDHFIYNTFLGGSQNDEAGGVAADGVGNVFVAGYTHSNDFPATVGPFLTPGAGLFGSSEDAFIARISEDLPPAPPANLHAGTVTATDINLIWADRSTNESGFKIERKTGLAGTYAQIDTVAANVTTYHDSGLTEGTTYVYRVRAYNAIGNSEYSNEAVILTRPAAPTDLTATVINERRINLAWVDHSASETGFRIERKANLADPWVAVGTVAADVTTYADIQVVESTTYYYRVLAFNSGGDSDPSNVATATTPALTIPIAPSGLVAVPLSATQARLNWTDNSYNEDGFKVERKTGAAGVWAQVGTAAANATAFNDSGLIESTSYYYRVRAFNNAGDSGYSNEAPLTTPANQPLLRVPIAAISFGQHNVCTLADLTTVIYNDGGAPLAVTSIARASGSADFAFQGPATPFNVPPLGSQAVTIRFTPSVTGALAAVFTVTSNDAANPSATFDVSGSGFIPTITLALQAQRLSERAWLIRRDYGRITITVTKSAPFIVTTYRLERRTGTGAYQTLKDFTETDFTSASLTYLDLFLAAGTSYSYRVQALDCHGGLIAMSGEAGPVASPPQPVSRGNRIIKR